MPIPRRRRAASAALLAAMAMAAGCGDNAGFAPPPPPKVSVAHPVERPYTLYLEAIGNTAAVNSANLVARVSGFVEAVGYKDGDPVKKGAVLFTIEPETYDLRLKQSQAAEAAALATYKEAEAEYQRQAELQGRGVTSRTALDRAAANRDTAKANHQQAEINTRLAAINVEYTRVTAPFDGIVTARKASVGEYVGGGSGPKELATVIQLDPIHVVFTVAEVDALRIRAGRRERGLGTIEELRKIPAHIGIQTDAGYPHAGTLDYVSPNFDQTTGTVTARALLANADGALLPGLFVRVRVPIQEVSAALMVPEPALAADQAGRYVLVVGADNVTEARRVEIGPAVDGMRVIRSGLAKTDRIVVGGLIRVAPGQKVDPQMAAR